METSRKAAKNLSEARYFTGKPCKNGHIAFRYVSSGVCAECMGVVSDDKRGPRRYKTSPVSQKRMRRWNNSDVGRAAKAAWRVANPKAVWLASALGTAKMRARRKSVEFSITHAYLRSILTDECPVFGTPFSFLGNKYASPDSPSLDRLDPALGYVEGNVVVISMKANSIKSAYGADDIRRVADWLSVKGYY